MEKEIDLKPSKVQQITVENKAEECSFRDDISENIEHSPAIEGFSYFKNITKLCIHNYVFLVIFTLVSFLFLFFNELRMFFFFEPRFTNFHIGINITFLIVYFMVFLHFCIFKRSFWKSTFFFTDILIFIIIVFDFPFVRNSIWKVDTTQNKNTLWKKESRI